MISYIKVSIKEFTLVVENLYVNYCVRCINVVKDRDFQNEQVVSIHQEIQFLRNYQPKFSHIVLHGQTFSCRGVLD